MSWFTMRLCIYLTGAEMSFQGVVCTKGYMFFSYIILESIMAVIQRHFRVEVLEQNGRNTNEEWITSDNRTHSLETA